MMTSIVSSASSKPLPSSMVWSARAGSLMIRQHSHAGGFWGNGIAADRDQGARRNILVLRRDLLFPVRALRDRLALPEIEIIHVLNARRPQLQLSLHWGRGADVLQIILVLRAECVLQGNQLGSCTILD